MSIARQLFREFRPFFQMLDEPFGRQVSRSSYPQLRSVFDDPFFTAPIQARPAVDVAEEGNNYIVEAELPGVKKEDVDVRIGDGGRSVTIEGKIIRRSGGSEPSQLDASTSASAAESTTDPATSGKSFHTAHPSCRNGPH